MYYKNLYGMVFFGVFCHLLEGTRERDFETEIARVAVSVLCVRDC